jgi:endonuclease-3
MPPRPGTRAHLLEVLRRLAETYGPRPWARHHPPLDELVTTVLSQSTTDANQHRAFAALKAAFPTWDDARRAPVEEVARAIRPAGLAVQKAPRIQRILDRAAEEPRGRDLEWLGEVPIAEAMAWLTALDGVGPKTAACVLCFSFGRPVVPVDTHVHRIVLRLGVVPRGTPAARAQGRLTRWVPPEEAYAAHMRMVAHGRALCRAQAPRCPACPLLDICPAGRSGALLPRRSAARAAPGDHAAA